MVHITSLSRLGRLSLGAAVAAGAVLGAAQITSGSTNSTEESVFVGLVPTRLLDTRQGQATYDGLDQAVGRLDANTTYKLDIAGRAGVPTDALSVTANLVAVNPSGPGHLTVYPCSADKPLASALNYMPGVNNANEFSVPLGIDGDVCIFTWAETDIVVDVYGYYKAGSAGTGEQGPAGPQGADGADGQDGANGADGTPGQDGATGPVGPEGPVGTGITVKGTLPNGEAGPPSFNGTDTGDVWIDTNNEAWVWTEADTWDDAGNIQGPAGADGQDAVSPARVIWVADDNTGDFTKLSDALASITDASATKPYLIKIAPGIYTETANVEMKDYVDVEGSGQDVTTIECACTHRTNYQSASVLYAGAITAELRDLTVSNTGGNQNGTSNNYAHGIYTNGVTDGSFSMRDMTVTSTRTDVNIKYTKGVYNKDSAYKMDNVTVIVDNTTINQSVEPSNYGIQNVGDTGDGTAILNNVTVSATNGHSNWALYNYEASAVAITNATIMASGGVVRDLAVISFGVGSEITIQNSSLTGATNSIKNDDNTEAKIANTKLDGPVAVVNSATLACSAAYNAAFTTLNATCS